jgi:hypothetical protein
MPTIAQMLCNHWLFSGLQRFGQLHVSYIDIAAKSRRPAQLLKIIKTGITGVGTRGAGTSEFRDN